MPPPDMPASSIFEALERGRLDAIGVGWLSGVARNLMAHPGADNDGVRWLAFESHERPIGAGRKDALVNGVKAALPERLLNDADGASRQPPRSDALRPGGRGMGHGSGRRSAERTSSPPPRPGRLPLPHA